MAEKKSDKYARIDDNGKLHLGNLVKSDGFDKPEAVVIDVPPSFIQGNAPSSTVDMDSIEDIHKAAVDSATRFKELFSD